MTKGANETPNVIFCHMCSGKGKYERIVDHDENYEAVYGIVKCEDCNGTGKFIKKKQNIGD